MTHDCLESSRGEAVVGQTVNYTDGFFVGGHALINFSMRLGLVIDYVVPKACSSRRCEPQFSRVFTWRSRCRCFLLTKLYRRILWINQATSYHRPIAERNTTRDFRKSLYDDVVVFEVILQIGWSDITVIYGHDTIPML